MVTPTYASVDSVKPPAASAGSSQLVFPFTVL
eukprot:GSChrysophyteH1.ASY1.ANO1.3338.1 assembled CDS